MNKKINVTISGPVNTEQTVMAALLTWALRKFNYTPVYLGPDRQRWMQLSGDEMELSQTIAKMFNTQTFPQVEIDEVHVVEVPATRVTVDVSALEAENAALKEENEKLKASPRATGALPLDPWVIGKTSGESASKDDE